MSSSNVNDIISKLNKGHIYTHSGGFHADDVCSTALLNMLCIKESIEIPQVHRICKHEEAEQKAKEGFLVFDIGCGEFDHHQADNEIRPNGVPYASFGKLYRIIGKELFGTFTEAFEEYFVQVIDKCDNSAEDNPFSALIRSTNPTFLEQQEGITIDQQFGKAVNIALAAFGIRQIMMDCNDYRLTDLVDDEEDDQRERDLQAIRAEEAAKDIITSALENKVVVDNAALIELIPGISYPVIKSIVEEYNSTTETPVLYYTFPSRGAFTMKPLTDILPPERWRGAKEFDIPGLTFCHSAGISMAVDSRETAKVVLSTILAENTVA